MMPIVLLCGNAGAGKDTAARILVEEYGAAQLALADPLKRFVSRALGIPDGLLWGGSAQRETVVPFDLNVSREQVCESWAARWVASLGGAGVHVDGLRWTWLERLHAYAREHGGVTPRYALQTLGTEWGREAIGLDVWIDYGLNTAREILRGARYERETGLAPRLSIDNARLPPLVAITDGRFPNEVLAVKDAGGMAVLVEDPESAPPIGHASETSLARVPRGWFDLVIRNDKRCGLDALRATVRRGLRSWTMTSTIATAEDGGFRWVMFF